MEAHQFVQPTSEQNQDPDENDQLAEVVYLDDYRISRQEPERASQQFLQAFDVMLALEILGDLEMAERLDNEIQVLAAESSAQAVTFMEWMAASESLEVRETATYHLPRLLQGPEDPEHEYEEPERQRLREVWKHLMHDEQERVSTEAQQSFIIAYSKIDPETFMQLRGQVDWQNQTDYAGRAQAAKRYFDITRSS